MGRTQTIGQVQNTSAGFEFTVIGLPGTGCYRSIDEQIHVKTMRM